MSGIQNYVTGNFVKPNTTRANRIASMLKNKNTKKPSPYASIVEPTIANRFFNLFSDRKKLPEGTFRKIYKGGRLTNYNKRALSFLSDRSRSMAMMDLSKIKSKKTRKALAKALNRTRRNR